MPIQADIQIAALAGPAARSSPAPAGFDLALCRRLDWRFLLPSPSLGNVAYLGSEKAQLRAALERFSGSLTVLSSESSLSSPTDLVGNFDIAVVSSASRAAIGHAAEIVKPGGWLYVEVGADDGWKAYGLEAYRAVLIGAGFHQVRAFWHRPTFEVCREIVPLDDPAVLDYLFSRGPKSNRTRLRSMMAAGARWTGLLALVLPCTSLIGAKPREAERMS